jgi:hypothetical protein
MNKKFKRRSNNERQSGFGLISLILGSSSFLIFAILVSLTLTLDYIEEVYLLALGFVGIISLLLGIIGLILGIMGLLQKERLKGLSLVGTILSGILTVALSYFYILGFIV